MSTPLTGTPILPSDLRSWTAEQVQQWFETFDDGQWKEYSHKFVGLNGQRLCDMTEQQFTSRIPGFTGRAIFNDVQKLLDHGNSPAPPSLLAGRATFCWACSTSTAAALTPTLPITAAP